MSPEEQEKLIDYFIKEYRKEFPRLKELYGRAPTIKELSLSMMLPQGDRNLIWGLLMTQYQEEIQKGIGEITLAE